MTLPREDITDDWREWKGQRLAWALEKHLISWQEYDQHSPPAWLKKHLDENEADEQPIPMGLGYHKQTGYFITCSAGQGPCIVGIENDPPKLLHPQPRTEDELSF